MSFRSVLLAAVVVTVGAGLSASGANAAIVCPTTTHTGSNAFGGCNLIVQFNADGSINTFAPTGATTNYDGSDDSLIGVVNNSGNSISSFTISGSSAHGGIFGGFDGDGIDHLTGVSNAAGTGLFDPYFASHGGLSSAHQYGGADAYFTNITSSVSGTVNFLTAIVTGGTDYFSLEAPIDVNAPPIINTPEPASLALLAVGVLALGAIRRRRA